MSQFGQDWGRLFLGGMNLAQDQQSILLHALQNQQYQRFREEQFRAAQEQQQRRQQATQSSLQSLFSGQQPDPGDLAIADNSVQGEAVRNLFAQRKAMMDQAAAARELGAIDQEIGDLDKQIKAISAVRNKMSLGGRDRATDEPAALELKGRIRSLESRKQALEIARLNRELGIPPSVGERILRAETASPNDPLGLKTADADIATFKAQAEKIDSEMERLKIAESLGKLNPNNPEHMKALVKRQALSEAMAEIAQRKAVAQASGVPYEKIDIDPKALAKDAALAVGNADISEEVKELRAMNPTMRDEDLIPAARLLKVQRETARRKKKEAKTAATHDIAAFLRDLKAQGVPKDEAIRRASERFGIDLTKE